MLKHCRLILVAVIFVAAMAANAAAQDSGWPNLAGTPPKLLLLVYQQYKLDKTAERNKLEASIARACGNLNVPNMWIDLETITGPAGALFFDPFDSFEHVEKALGEWGKIYATHPDMGRTQEELRTFVTSERTIIATRRDDLGFQAQSIDLSKARFLRVLEVRVNPGHEAEFTEAFKMLGSAYEKIRADTPWVVYQVNVGMQVPTFLVFVPMRALKQNDDLLNWRPTLRRAEGEEGAKRMEQIARDAYSQTESNLYVISPETSHVSKEFASGDAAFWSPKPSATIVPRSRSGSLWSRARRGRGTEVAVVAGDFPGEEHVFDFGAATNVVENQVAIGSGCGLVDDDADVRNVAAEIPSDEVAGRVV
jgi:hypothetical protein